MKAKQVAEKLLEHPELDVFFQDPNSHDGPFSVEAVVKEISEGEYPEDFNMPEGYQFLLLMA